MNTDPIADLLTRLRNASLVKHPIVKVPFSGVKERIVDLLKDEGYIQGYKRGEDASGKPDIKIQLKYTETGDPVISEIKRISTPGRRSYVPKDKVPWCRGGLGVIVVSTSRGLMSDREARKQGVGGELICSVF